MQRLNGVVRSVFTRFPKTTELSNGQSVSSWPTVQDVVITALLAVFLTSLDLHFSSQLGLLSYPPGQDGITYMAITKQTFYRLRLNSGESWSHLPAQLSVIRELVSLIIPPAVLWYLLILLSFLVFGEGEWQCYTVRFWPTFLLLLLMVWVIRRRGNASLAWLCATFTALLPIISVHLRSTARDYFTGQVVGPQGYLADLRPDLLFAVLLLWAVVPLVENVHRLERRSLLVSGTFAGLAILCKTSASPMLLLAWGLAFLYVFAVNRRQLLSTVRTCLWVILPFGLLLAPYALAGGAKNTFQYLLIALTSWRNLFSDPNATFFSEAKYYWLYFPDHMGHLEGWLLLGMGLISFLVVWFKLKHTDSRLLAYLGLSAALYALPSLTPNKNYFVGLPYYLLLWLFSWIALTPLLLWASQNRFKVFIVALAGLYATAQVTAGFYALQNWPVEYQQAGLTNRASIDQIATDLKAVLSPNDCYVPLDHYQYSANITYALIDSQRPVYSVVAWDISSPLQTVESFVKSAVTGCKAILTYKEDLEKVSQYVWLPTVTFPYFKAVAQMVRQSGSNYRLFQDYKLVFNSGNLRSNDSNNLTIQLYVKQ